MTLYLNRHTGLNITCRVRFNLRIGGGGGDVADEDDDGGGGGGRTNGPRGGATAGNGNAAAAAAAAAAYSFSSSPSVESGMLDELSDSDGRSYGWLPRTKMADLVTKGVLRLVVEMFSVNTVRPDFLYRAYYVCTKVYCTYFLCSPNPASPPY